MKNQHGHEGWTSTGRKKTHTRYEIAHGVVSCVVRWRCAIWTHRKSADQTRPAHHHGMVYCIVCCIWWYHGLSEQSRTSALLARHTRHITTQCASSQYAQFNSKKSYLVYICTRFVFLIARVSFLLCSPRILHGAYQVRDFGFLCLHMSVTRPMPLSHAWKNAWITSSENSVPERPFRAYLPKITPLGNSKIGGKWVTISVFFRGHTAHSAKPTARPIHAFKVCLK